MLARDKALSKSSSRTTASGADFTVVRYGHKPVLSKKLRFPLIVKSLFFEASAGISQASVVENAEQLARRVQFIHESLGTAAIVEQFIDGRELYVGVLGNERLDVYPVWEMSFAQMPDNRWRIATERVKWSTQYQKKHGIMTNAAKLDATATDGIQRIAKRAYRALDLNGMRVSTFAWMTKDAPTCSKPIRIRTWRTERTSPNRRKSPAPRTKSSLNASLPWGSGGSRSGPDSDTHVYSLGGAFDLPVQIECFGGQRIEERVSPCGCEGSPQSARPA